MAAEPTTPAAAQADRAAGSGSTSAPRPGSARPSTCSARVAAGPAAAPTSSSASTRSHGREYTAEQVGDLPVVPRRVRHPSRRRADRDGHRRGARPAPGRRARRRARAHQRPRLAAREALAGRRTAPRRRHRRDHHGEHPAPRIAQRRGRRHHRHHAGRDRPRRGRPRRRADRTRRHDPAGAAPADGARAHLPGGPDRHRAGQLLPGGQPHRAARAGAALGRRPGRGRTRPVPGRARHPRHLGRPRPDRRRADRRSRRGHAAPPRRPDRRAGRRPVTDRACTSSAPTAPSATSATEIEQQRLLAENLGGSLQLVVGDDIAATVLEFARSVNGTQIIVGASRHGRLAQLVRPSVANAIVRGSGDIDVYVVTHPRAARRRIPRLRTPAAACLVLVGRGPAAHRAGRADAAACATPSA